MRGSVWILIMCYMTNRQGSVYGKEQVYGYSEVRQVNTNQQQKTQYYKALNKALATYRSNHNLDSDTEIHYTHLNDGITYEGSRNGKKVIKRKRTNLTGSDKREVRREVLQNKKVDKGERTITEKQAKKMYDKKITQKEYNLRAKNKEVKEDKIREIEDKTDKLSKEDKLRLIKKLQKKN